MNPSPFRFEGKHVFVAGGTSGINLGIALGFAAAGARLSVLSRKQEKIDAAVKALAESGEAKGYAADVRDYAAIDAAMTAAAKAFGNIDVLVSGAAGNFVAPALGMSSNGFRAVMDIDLLGTFHVMRAAYPHLTKPGAAIVNISAPQAFIPMMLQAHVCAAKAGVDMLTKTLAMEWARDGIRVNSIAPGPIEGTEGMARLAPTADAEKAARRSVPLNRFGQREEIAAAAQFLCSDQAAYITGVVLPVDGGQTIGGYNPSTLDMMGKMGIVLG